ncbi:MULTISPECIES: ABC transporter permease [Vibrio]|uniref:ABC transporter permease n=1 Tax=Vibrio casei TaxID=673372 RepID=A0A368LJE1_9VIBR|nr:MULTISPECIES: ABC transporter permease [Vibrio]RCS70864.1 ABC transporter permease [Vibrio casei]SJN40459.1 Ribose/xylose/arabinose/galactoside ABC-type transport systems, permease components [Vibrio casei]HBV76642.1 ABC transporter permease [Vibrio sp.]
MNDETLVTPKAPKSNAPKIQWRDYIIYLVFIGIFAFFSIMLHDKGFLSSVNLMNIARQTATIAIMAVGMTFVLSAAEIDLSFGATVALAAIVSALTLQETDSILLAVSAALAVGTMVGFINGIFVTQVGIPSFLVTLGTTGIITGIARWSTSLQSIPIDNDTYTFIFGSGDIGPFSILFVWALLVTVIGAFILRNTTFGKHVLATGGNKVSAMYSGININRIKLYVLMLNGFLAALAGILYSGRLYSARYTLGENDLMLVIAAVIIGGTNLFGGRGTVVGSVIGALIMGMVNNGLLLMGLNVDQQLILRGIIVIVAVTFTMGQIRQLRKK